MHRFNHWQNIWIIQSIWN